MNALRILPLEESGVDAVVALAVRAWAPVFPRMRAEMPPHVYDAFYPHGWEARQRADIAAICRDEATTMFIALQDGGLAGFLGLRAHAEDSMGEVHVIAVDPVFQRRGIAAALIDFAMAWMRERGLKIAMVETGGDSGHAPSRATYEHAGFAQLPIARYFRKL
ncbi:MAG: GNAT family N-acetyltransferase [Alphaproteobacteria bacterium]|nr:GNAT family N-acetyltransferase [Alphaproteobacteria bacterium]